MRSKLPLQRPQERAKPREAHRQKVNGAGRARICQTCEKFGAEESAQDSVRQFAGDLAHLALVASAAETFDKLVNGEFFERRVRWCSIAARSDEPTDYPHSFSPDLRGGLEAHSLPASLCRWMSTVLTRCF